MALGFNIPKFFQPAEQSPEPQDMRSAAQEMFNLKKGLLADAATLAAERNETMSLEHYRLVAQEFGKSDKCQAMFPNGEWTPAVAANLSGQDLENITITEPDHKHLSEPHKREMTEIMNLDGDGAINDFYTNIDFTGANIKDCIVDPATSFNAEIAKAKTHENITFNDMRTGDSFTFGSGTYNNVKLTNINGGEIAFSNGTQVNGLDIKGMQASIRVEQNAVVSKIKVDDKTRILTLDTKPGAQICDSDLREATISMTSEMKGIMLSNVKFSGNMNDVNMRGAVLKRVTLDDANTQGLDLGGANIQDLTINGKLMTHVSELAQFGIKAEGATVSADPKLAAAAQEAARAAKQAAAIAAAKNAGKQILWEAPKQEVAKQEVPNQPEMPKAEMKATAMVDGSKGQYDQMNADMTKAPAPKPDQVPSPLQKLLAGEGLSFKLGQENYTSSPAPAAAKQNSPAKAPDAGIDLRTYYARMSSTNGRA